MEDNARTEPSPPARRLRFSLLTVVLSMTIVALVVGLYRSKQRNDRLAERNAVVEQENRRHRNTLGIFEIEDPKKIHTLRLPTEDGAPRKYRVYLPEGRKYWFHYRTSVVPREGILPSHSITELMPGEYLFSIIFKRDKDRATDEPIAYGTFSVRIDSQAQGNHRGTHLIGVSQRENDWILNPETGHTSFSWQEVARELELAPLGEPVVLYRARAVEPIVKSRDASGKATSWSSKPIKGPCEGFMMWVSDQEEHP